MLICTRSVLYHAVFFLAYPVYISSTDSLMFSYRNDAEWDHIVYTQQWAQSSCEYQNV